VRAVLLCGVVALLGASAWHTASEIVSRVSASSANQPTLEMTGPAAQRIESVGPVRAGWASFASRFNGLVSKTRNSPLSAAAPLAMPEADSGSYAGRIEGTLRDTLVRASVPVDIQEQIARNFAARLDLAAPAQEGDTYHVLYERDDTTTQRKRVTALEIRSGREVH
jgi:hypothetical protein